MNAITVSNICKTFDGHAAVQAVSFEVPTGQIFGLLGPNGAGKTTTIRMIMDIIIPDSGDIRFDNQNRSDAVHNRIGYLPEERGLYRKMKINDLLLFLAQLKSMTRKTAQPKINAWLERFDLMAWKNKKVEELSKGMQQKLQFIGTILHDPKLIILDEPFIGLDPINAQLLKDIILELKAKGMTIIFSTHQMESAEKLCENIFLINHGKQVLNGSLDDIKKQYGHQNILLDYNGNGDFLKKLDGVKQLNAYGNSVEIQIMSNTDPQAILQTAMKHVEIRKFEIKAPSLHEIFIETIQTSQGKETVNES